MDEPTSSKKPQLTRSLPRPDTSNEKEVIDSIEAPFFVDDEFDSNEYELNKLSPLSSLCIDDVDRERGRLKAQLLVVSKKISTLILEKAPSYTSQMDDMASIRAELGEVVQRVQTIRRYLSESRSKSSYALGVLSVHRQQGLLREALQLLQRIKTLHETEYRIEELIERGLYPLAIRVCAEAAQAAVAYSHFTAVSEVSLSLSASSSSLSSSLDSALSSLTATFDPDHYLQVYGAYRMLGKVEDAASRLVTLFCASLERRARAVLLSESGEASETMSYERMSELIQSDRVAETLRELGFSLCQILINVHSIISLHNEEDERDKLVDEKHVPSLISRTLSSSLFSIFRTALVRFNTLLCCHDFALLKFDDVLTIIELATRFRSFGRAHFGYAGVEIDVSLEKQSSLFFSRQHTEKMDELRMFIENEAFAVCPLPPNFTLFDLQEFSFLHHSTAPLEGSPRHRQNEVGEQQEFTLINSDAPNPFSPEAPKPQPKQRTASSRLSNGSSLDRVGSIDSTDSHNSNTTSPRMCNAALMVLRLLGRYIRMTSLLHSVADRSIPAIIELFEYFLFAITDFFTRDGSDFADPLPARLKSVCDSIDLKIFQSGNSFLTRPSLSCIVQLSQADRLFALPERLVAIESLEFVARQLDLTRPVIESLMKEEDATSSAKLTQFFDQVVAAVPDVRLSILNTVASKALKLSTLLSTIGTTQWNVNELQSKHSTYVDFLVQDLEVFSLRVQHLCIEQPFDESIKALLWDQVVKVALKAILHGYGQIGARCTNEGRALMQLDMQHLSGRLEKMTGRKMTEEIAKVDAYIKAYYLPEKNLEEWALSHPEYTLDQVTSLLASTPHVSKKTRTRIINALTQG